MVPCCYDVAASMLLCAEEYSSIMCSEEDEENEEELVVEAVVGRKRGRSPGHGEVDFGVDLFPPPSEECVAGLVERELEHMPRDDYGERLLLGGGGGGGGDVLCVRREAIDWIWKVYTYYNFRPLTAYLAVNYLDRFLSLYQLPERMEWMAQLLSVTCVSLAAKMEEVDVPKSLELQVGDVRYVFEAKAVQSMELVVLSTLSWRMQAVTPFSYMDYILNKLNGGKATPRSWLSQSTELILCAARGTGCIGFRPSEIAAAIAAAVVGEVHLAGIGNAHVDKERVLRCQDAIRSMASSSAIDTVPPKSAACGRSRASSPVPVPQSPVGVLDAGGYLSYKSEDDGAAATVASHVPPSGSSGSSPRVTSKRRKLTSR